MVVDYSDAILFLEDMNPGEGFITSEDQVPYLLVDETPILDVFNTEYWGRGDDNTFFVLACNLLTGDMKIFPTTLKVHKVQLRCTIIT